MRIYRLVAVVIVPDDVVEMDRFGDAGPLIQIARIGPEVGIVDQSATVALEVQVIDGIEPHQRREKPPVGFCRPVAEKETRVGKPTLQPVERVEKRADGGIVRFLRGGEARLVDAVVDRRIDALVQRFDPVAQRLGPVVIAVAGQPVEGRC